MGTSIISSWLIFGRTTYIQGLSRQGQCLLEIGIVDPIVVDTNAVVLLAISSPDTGHD